METEACFHEHATGEPIDGLPPPGPCPFCKTISKHCGIVTLPGEESNGLTIEATYHVQCDYCGAEGSAESSQLDAAVKWNAATQLSTCFRKALWEQQRLVWQAQAVVQCITAALLNHFGNWPAELPGWNLALETVEQMLGRTAEQLGDEELIETATNIARATAEVAP